MFAQALGEYGLLSRATGTIETLFNDVTLWVQDAGPGAWVGFGAVAIALIWFSRRRR